MSEDNSLKEGLGCAAIVLSICVGLVLLIWVLMGLPAFWR